MGDLFERAREAIARHEVNAHFARLRALGDRLEQAEQTASELRGSLARELAVAEAAASQRVAAAVRELPPLGVVGTVASIERAARRHLFRHVSLGGCHEQRRAIVFSLEALAKNVVDTWVPGFDADALRAVVVDEATRRRCARPLVPLEEHPVLGFAPIAPEALAGRIATQLDNEGYRHARAVMAKEAADLDVALTELAAARKRKRLFSSADERAEARLGQTVGRERMEAFAACETVAVAFHQALSSVPPLAIWLAAESLVALHAGAAPQMEHVVHLDGVTRLIPMFIQRAFVIDALASLRRATKRAFPGLLALVEGEEASARPRAEKSVGSPFRVAAITAGGDDASPANVSELMALYDRAGLPEMLRRGRVHALLAGSAARSSANARLRVTALDRVAIWSDSLAETDERVATRRADWHRAALLDVASGIARTIWPPGQRFQALRVRDLLVRLSLAIGMVKTRGDDFTEDVVCPVLNKQLVYPLLDALAAEISGHGSLVAALHEVRSRLEGVTAMRVAYRQRSLERRYRCELFGFGELCAANHQLARVAFAVIGEMPPDGLLLCHYVEQLGTAAERR